MALAQMTVTWGGITFQCAPLEEFAVETAYEHADYLTVSSGEYSRPHGAKLKSLSFETLVTPDKETWLGTGVGTEIVKQLQDACASGEHYELKAIERAEVLANFQATLRSVRVTTKAGEPGTRYLSVAFVEYRSVTFDSTSRPVPPTSPVTTQKLKIKGGIWLEAPKGWKNTPKPLCLNDLATAFGFDKRSVGVTAIRKANPKLKLPPATQKLNNWGALAKNKTVTIRKGKGATK